VPAGDADEDDVAELIAAVQGPSTATDVEPEDIGPSEGALAAETAVVSTNRQTSSDSSENCTECGEAEPPHGSRRQKRVHWVQCDSCNGWFHLCCTHLKKVPPKNTNFNCINCR